MELGAERCISFSDYLGNLQPQTQVSAFVAGKKNNFSDVENGEAVIIRPKSLGVTMHVGRRSVEVDCN